MLIPYSIDGKEQAIHSQISSVASLPETIERRNSPSTSSTTKFDAPVKVRRANKFVEPIKDIIYKALYSGLTFNLAAQRAGISPATLQSWIDQGTREIEECEELGLDPIEGSFGDFVQKCYKYIAFNVEENLEAIKQAGTGGLVTRDVTRTRVNKDGTQVVENEKQYTAPNWQANAWLVERRHDEYKQRPSTETQTSQPKIELKFVYVENWRSPIKAAIDPGTQDDTADAIEASFAEDA